MTPEKEPESLNPVPKREELAEMLRQGLDPDLDYFDATASIEAIAKELRRQAEVQRIIAEHQNTLGNALISAHEKILQLAKDINDAGVPEVAAAARGEAPPMFRPANLIHPGGHPLRKGN